MLILIAVLIALLPTIAILYPFVRHHRVPAPTNDIDTPRLDLERKWESAISNLRTTELEYTVGNLSYGDYHQLQERYMSDAAQVMKDLQLEQREEKELLDWIDSEVAQIRTNIKCAGDETQSTD